MNITDYILSKVPKDIWLSGIAAECKLGEFSKKPECKSGIDRIAGYHMFNTGGVEIEVGEFLYAFVKLIKPDKIIETGTAFGVAAMYIGIALKENEKGILTTIEVNPAFHPQAKALWTYVGVEAYINQLTGYAESINIGNDKYDIAFLDTEPHLRWKELIKFYPNITPGGYIIIHDVHPHLSWFSKEYSEHMVGKCTNIETGSLGIFYPFGDFRPIFGHLIADFSLQTVYFQTPRGLVMFQKWAPWFGHYRFLGERE